MERLRIGFVMDPMESVNIEDDTSCALIMECQKRGHEIYYLLLKDLFIFDNKPIANLRKVTIDKEKGFRLLDFLEKKPLDGLDVIFVRKEPPFNMDYLYSTYILEHITKKTFVINDPKGIRKANEKLYVLNFPEIAPKNCISKNPRMLKEFFVSLGGEMIIKPLDSYGGRGIFYLKEGDKNINALLESLTLNSKRFVIGQEYLPQIKDGDKRILILNGKPIGAFKRIPPQDDHRGNIHAGGRCEKSDITEKDREICSILSKKLIADGLYFVGIDVIGDKVSEINVTSPAGIPEINSFNQCRLEEETIDFVEGVVSR